MSFGSSCKVFLPLCWATLAFAQAPSMSPDQLSQMRYRYIGPVGNRVIAAASMPGDPNVYYAGSASGGIFKTTDGGTHWTSVFDAQPVSSVGSLAIAESDPNLVWAGTGETFIRSYVSVGDGIYKSTDAGKTWTHMGLDKTGRIGRIVIDPRNDDVVLACALGHAYGPQQERGVFRTADGGETWNRVLFVDENTGCSDIAIDPNNAHILYAGMWQVEIRTGGGFSRGPGSGLYKSNDGGVTWEHLTGHGLPGPPLGKIGLAVAKKTSRVYALIDTGAGFTGAGVREGGQPTQRGSLWLSDDAGENWQVASYNRQIGGRPPYFTRCAVSPDNENEIFFLNTTLLHSLDGGRTLAPTIPWTPQWDHHDMWIDPTNGDRMVVADDGGLAITVNRGRSWRHVQLPNAQMYHVTVDNQVPYFVYGNRQDGPGAAFRGPSNSLLVETPDDDEGEEGGGGSGDAESVPSGGPIPRAWQRVGGGENGFATPDPVDPNIIWSSGSDSGSGGGIVTVLDLPNRQVHEVEVWPEPSVGDEAKYRFNLYFPLAISPHDHNKVYVGSQYLMVTTDQGNSWKVVSPDLTRNDKSKQSFSGGLTGDTPDALFAIAESPRQAGVIWTGSNDGLVQITRDDGKTWTNVTANIPDLPGWGTVSSIEASRYDTGSAYITVDLHEVNNRDPFVYKTNDYGKTWTKINNGIPPSMLSYAHCIREDPVRKGLLFLGTENAVYVSFDNGENWQPLQLNLPHAPAVWIAMQEHFHDLVLATYGRGIWIFDDITPLEQMTAQTLTSDAYLFAPRDAYRFRNTLQQDSQMEGDDPTEGQNPPYGASINFYLKARSREGAHIAIVDSSGTTVRTLTTRAQPGLNRVWWDLRFEGTKPMQMRPAPGAQASSFGQRSRGITILAPPGTYTLKLTAAGKDYTQPLNVLKDPHSNGTEGDIQIQTKLMMSISDTMNNVVDTVNEIELLRAQLKDVESALADDQNAEPVRTAEDQLSSKLAEVEGNLIQSRGNSVRKIGYLADEVESGDFQPTTQEVAVYNELKEQTETYRQRLTLLEKDVAAFNALLRRHNILNVVGEQ
jgi:photosystem II stability/assembly factor-like uncharacterized protein